MHHGRILGLAMLLGFTTQTASAQQSGCDFNAGFTAFDFWVGSWDVTDNTTGNVAGSNRIEKIEAGCVVMEHWTSVGGGTGTSLNYYNPVTDVWRQLWVSAGRYSIDIVGGLQNGAMVLTGELHNFVGNSSIPFRGTWTPQDDGSVRQFFEQFNAETNVWDPWFDGRYVRTE